MVLSIPINRPISVIFEFAQATNFVLRFKLVTCIGSYVCTSCATDENQGHLHSMTNIYTC